jgi:hypothetical protein
MCEYASHPAKQVQTHERAQNKTSATQDYLRCTNIRRYKKFLSKRNFLLLNNFLSEGKVH